MSNVQVHCDNCNTSLYELNASMASNVKPDTILLFTEHDPLFRDRPWDAGRLEFCDWVCVRAWARSKQDEATS